MVEAGLCSQRRDVENLADLHDFRIEAEEELSGMAVHFYKA